MENTVMLTWEEVVNDFEKLVKYAAKTVYLNRLRVDNSISAEDLFQIGMLKLYECHTKYSHLPKEEFKAIFCKALFRAVKRGAKSSDTVEIEEAILSEEGHEDSYIEELTCSDVLKDLKQTLKSPIAVAILQELVEPSPRTLWEVWADKARKKHFKQDIKKHTYLSRTTEVKMKHIIASLGITQKEFDLGILEIRSQAKVAFGL